MKTLNKFECGSMLLLSLGLRQGHSVASQAPFEHLFISFSPLHSLHSILIQGTSSPTITRQRICHFQGLLSPKAWVILAICRDLMATIKPWGLKGLSLVLRPKVIHKNSSFYHCYYFYPLLLVLAFALEQVQCHFMFYFEMFLLF